MKKIIFLVPAFNEEKNLKKVILDFKKFGKVLVINDASKDKTKTIAKKYSDHYLENKKNIGYDKSLQKGLIYLSKKNYNNVITVDADGQHRCDQVQKYIKFFKKYDIIIGSRNLLNRPIEKKISLLSKKTFNIFDPLSGMKFYNLKKIKKRLKNLDKKFNYFGMFFLEWINDLKITNIKIIVHKSNKISSIGKIKNIEKKFLKSFLKIKEKNIHFTKI